MPASHAAGSSSLPGREGACPPRSEASSYDCRRGWAGGWNRLPILPDKEGRRHGRGRHERIATRHGLRCPLPCSTQQPQRGPRRSRTRLLCRSASLLHLDSSSASALPACATGCCFLGGCRKGSSSSSWAPGRCSGGAMQEEMKAWAAVSAMPSNRSCQLVSPCRSMRLPLQDVAGGEQRVATVRGACGPWAWAGRHNHWWLMGARHSDGWPTRRAARWHHSQVSCL